MNNKCFFAAANGYDGFRSNFDKVFSADKINKLFVIKGGPGTGKSTLMKKVAASYMNVADLTYIYCSSDPKSLDGVIIEKNGFRVGIADGTSPHAVEPKYPGAFEEIINLGDGFDYHRLLNLSKHIYVLTKQKKQYYKKAYSALKNAGNIHRYIIDYILNCDIYCKAEYVVKSLIKDLYFTESTIKDYGFLIGAFSKEGYVRIDNAMDKNKIEICGDGISEYVLMSKIKDILMKNKTISHIYPSAFSNDIYDCLETDMYQFTVNNQSSKAIDSTELITLSLDYKEMKNTYDKLIDEAKKSFEIASEYHFKLEDIYSSSISFEKNADIYSKVVEDINYLLSK